MEAGQIIAELGLQPGTCRFMAPTYVGAHGAALYFPHHARAARARPPTRRRSGVPLLRRSPAGHRVLTADGPQLHTLGRFGQAGCQAQLAVPAGTVHGSRTRGSYTLACTTSFSEHRPEVTAATTEELAAAGDLGFS